MKKTLIFLVIAVVAWQSYFKDKPIVAPFTATDAEFSNSDAMRTLNTLKEMAKPNVAYQCDGRQHCSQMGSYEEAKYFLQHCPDTKMDGDHDGIPCERQF